MNSKISNSSHFNNTKSAEVKNHEKKFIIILSVLAIVFSIGTHLMLINSNLVYFVFRNFATLSFFILPILCVAIIIISAFFIFKKNNVSFIIPVAASLVGCLLAYVLVDSSSVAKYQSDFLRHENEFKRIVEEHIESGNNEGRFTIESNDLNFVIPEKKLIVVSVGNNKCAYFFVAADIENRLEGYVYEPYGSPRDWLENGQYSDTLDIDGKWFYFAYYKGENYDKN